MSNDGYRSSQTHRTVTILQLKLLHSKSLEPGRLTGEVTTLPDCEKDRIREAEGSL